MKKRAKILAMFFVALVIASTATGEIIFVDAGAFGANDGSSWVDAFADLQEALTFATAFPQVEEIRVAQGAYTPEGSLPDIRQARNPNPANGATGVSRTADLSWTAGLDATSHDVYFGTSSPGMFQGNQSETTFDPGAMDNGKTYYWRIDGLNQEGKTTTGRVWRFTTIGVGPSSTPLGDSNEQAAPEVMDREATFQLINGVVIKGGYAGFGEPNADARDFEVYETVLSGDIGIPDNNSDNSYHVVTGTGCDQTAVLDGFIITGGNANGPVSDWPVYDYSRRYGGGMFNNNGSPTVTNCTLSGNSAEWRGGGMSNHDGSSPTVTNCKFSSNHAAWGVGGGMANVSSSPTISNCTFSENKSGEGGGGLSNYDSNMVLFNCMFRNNSSVWEGGGMSNSRSADPVVKYCTFIGNSSIQGGGIHNYESSLKMTNCKVSGNRAKWSGGGIYVWVGFGGPGGGCFTERPSNVTLISCTFSENQAEDGRALACDSCYNQFPSKVQITNCIIADGGEEIWNNDDSTISITYSDVQGGWPGEGNIETDPRFVDSGFWDANGVWIDGDYHLLPGSPCIDAGEPNHQYDPNETDLDGKPRIIGNRIDMGAYEYNFSIPAEVRITPSTINPASKGKWITCYIRLAEGYDVNDIDFHSLLFEYVIEPEQLWVDEKKQVVMARFSREEVRPILEVGDIELTITGQLTDGTVFGGTNVVKVIDIDKGSGKLAKLGEASNPNPADGATGVSRTADLSWTAGSDATSHDVYFGTSNPPPFIRNQTSTTFDPGTMDYDKTYFWRIDEVNKWGKTTGTVWSFTTRALPGQASDPDPVHGATGVSTTADLSWTAGSDATSHDVYFGTSSTPPFVGNQTYTTFDPGRMAYSTTYYWRIDEVNKWGKTTGTVWSFTTWWGGGPSDARLKTDIKTLTNVLDKVEKIRGISFEWSEVAGSIGISDGRRQIGVIAQDVEAVFPELVGTSKGIYKGVEYHKLTAVLIEAVKELKAENENLKRRIEVLETAVQQNEPGAKRI